MHLPYLIVLSLIYATAIQALLSIENIFVRRHHYKNSGFIMLSFQIDDIFPDAPEPIHEKVGTIWSLGEESTTGKSPAHSDFTRYHEWSNGYLHHDYTYIDAKVMFEKSVSEL